jgi:hypothetical protein
VVLFGVEVAFGGEFCNFLLSEFIVEFHLFFFAELVEDFDKSLSDIWEFLDITNFAKNPSFLVVVAVDKAVEFGVF